MGRRTAAVALAAAGVLAACAPGGSTPGAPVRVAAPTAAPATDRSSGVCAVRPPAEPPGQVPVGVVAVDPGPDAATLVWLPGLGSTACSAQLTTVGAAPAAALARAVLAAPAVGPGRFDCPADDLTAVDVHLRYPGRTDGELVEVALSGCTFLSAPGRTARWSTTAVRALLRDAAPPEWAARLSR